MERSVAFKKLGVNDCKVQLPSGPKVFHANLLKLYHSRSEIMGNLEVMPIAFGVIENDSLGSTQAANVLIWALSLCFKLIINH